MSRTKCAPLSMCGSDFDLYHSVMTWLPCVSLIFIYFFLSKTWLHGELTGEYIAPWKSFF